MWSNLLIVFLVYLFACIPECFVENCTDSWTVNLPTGVEMDVEIFGSGMMTEDDGSAFNLEDEAEHGSNVAGGSSSSISNGAAHSSGDPPQGIRLFLSAIKEWMIEFGANMIFISIRTDGAWYRLGKPSSQYLPWYSPILRTARLAIKIITMLKHEQRVSRLSFTDILKRLTEQLKDDPKFNLMKIADVERYLVVHGQIILQQFAEYPDEQIRRSAFVSGLTTKMEQMHHTKMVVSKKTVIRKGRNLNPRAHLQPDARKSKPMRATTTKLVNRIWSTYYTRFSLTGELASEVKEEPEAEQQEVEVEEEAVEEESEGEEDTTLLNPRSHQGKRQLRQSQSSEKVQQEFTWVGRPDGKKTSGGEVVYKKALFNGEEIAVGGTVLVQVDEDDQEDEQLLSIVLVEYLYQSRYGNPMLHGRVLVRAGDTLLGNAGDEREVFLSNQCVDVEIAGAKRVVVQMKRRPEGYTDRKANAAADEAERERAGEIASKGLPKEYYCRATYEPERGAFLSLPTQGLAVGDGTCKACTLRKEEEESKTCRLLDDGGFKLEGVEYRIGDHLYVDPSLFKSLENKDEPEAEVIFKGGRNKGLRPFAICQLLSVQKTKKNILSTSLSVQRFYRPDDFGTHRGYIADIHEVYISIRYLLVQ